MQGWVLVLASQRGVIGQVQQGRRGGGRNGFTGWVWVCTLVINTHAAFLIAALAFRALVLRATRFSSGVRWVGYSGVSSSRRSNRYGTTPFSMPANWLSERRPYRTLLFSIFPSRALQLRCSTPRICPVVWSWSPTALSLSVIGILHRAHTPPCATSVAARHTARLLAVSRSGNSKALVFLKQPG